MVGKKMQKGKNFFPHLLIWRHFRHHKNSISQNSSQSTNGNTEEVIPIFSPPRTPNCKHDSTQKLGVHWKGAAKNQEEKKRKK